MPKEYSRSQRVVEQIRRELAELIRLEVKDPRVGFITLTDVEITPDYAHAKVFFTNMTGEADVPEILQGLRRASGFLRRELVIAGLSEAEARPAAAAVLREFDRLHRVYHAWQPSELSALNAALAAGQRQPITPIMAGLADHPRAGRRWWRN